MEALKDKQTRSYDYISRYSPFSYYYNVNDNKYIYEITSQLNENIPFVEHKIEQKDTLDSLAFYYYGRPDLYWVIADFNRIQDPLEKLYGKYNSLNIPKISDVSFIMGK